MIFTEWQSRACQPGAHTITVPDPMSVDQVPFQIPCTAQLVDASPRCSYDRYTEALREVGISVDWAHFYFSAHAHHALRIGRGLRPTLHAGVDFNLIRLTGGPGILEARP